MWINEVKDGENIFIALISDESLYVGDIMFKSCTETSRKMVWQDVKERSASASYFPMIRIKGKGKPKISVYGDLDFIKQYDIIHIDRAEITAPSEIWGEGVRGDVYVARNKDEFLKFMCEYDYKNLFIKIKELRHTYYEKMERAQKSHMMASDLVEPYLKY